ncbi:MAG: SH3 domain-containing protein [Pseudomonadota bacterium]|nr:SH3 domain-containing protein [Pseudomonadota bacterium]
MRRLLALVLLVQALNVGIANAAAKNLVLIVADPYLEMRSGPGRGFPVVYVIERDELVTVLYSRTDWFKVRGARGNEGWVRRTDLARTMLESGEPAPIPPYPEFASHRWELGAGYGVFNRENLVTAYADFGLTTSLDVEFVVQQAFGTLDDRYVASFGLRHTFIPEWKWFSPTAGIGTAYQYIQDKVPPAPLQKSNEMAYVSVGARGFITRRFLWRADWRHYVVFNNRNVYKDLEEWKFGLAVFF